MRPSPLLLGPSRPLRTQQELQSAPRQFVDQADLLDGTGIHAFVHHLLPDFPKFSKELKARCTKGASARKPGLPCDCPLCASLTNTAIGKKPGFASLWFGWVSMT